jgi:hypothetical protein
VPFIAGDGVQAYGISRLLPEEMGHLHVVAFWDPESTDPELVALRRRFVRLIGREPDGAEVMRHEALMVLAEAVAEVGPRRDRIREFLASLGGSRPPVDGPTGPISFGTGPGPMLVIRSLDAETEREGCDSELGGEPLVEGNRSVHC